METNEQEEVIVDDLEDTNEEVEESTEEQVVKTKPKRSPQEELEYLEGRAARIRKKLGKDSDQPEKVAKSDLDLGGIAYLNSMVGLKGKDEIALAREYVNAGKLILDLPDNKYFKQDLEALREARISQEAVPKSAKRSTTPSGDDFQVAFTKYQDSGVLPEDRSLREKVVDAAIAKTKGTGAFSDNPIIFGGAQMQ